MLQLSNWTCDRSLTINYHVEKPQLKLWDCLNVIFFWSLKILLFFNHWSSHLFQSNQRFQGIEFVDRTVPEKLYIFNLPCMAFVTPRYLSPISTVSARIACVAGVKRGRRRGNLGARGRKERNACKETIVFSIFHAQILSVKIVVGQN